MKEHPIIFSTPMVRAILEGRKTQTRRIIRDVPDFYHLKWLEGPKTGQPRHIMDWPLSGVYQADHDGYNCIKEHFYLDVQTACDDNYHREIKCPYGTTGDHLWVRESWCLQMNHKGFVYDENGNHKYWYRASDPDIQCLDEDGGYKYRKDGLEASPWRPSIHMPRHASRITLEITNIRVEKLQDISEEDAIAEGMISSEFDKTYRYSFSIGWDDINAKRGSWESNPWVWVLSFKRI